MRRIFILVQIGFILSISFNIGYSYWLGEDGKLFNGIHQAADPLVGTFMAIAIYKQQDPAKKEALIDKYKTLSVGFYRDEKDPSTNTIAWCNHLTNEIGINADLFMERTFEMQSVILFHELAHCLMGKPHADYGSDWIENVMIFFGLIPQKGYYADNCPKSLMHPYEISEQCLNDHANEYLDDLFTW